MFVIDAGRAQAGDADALRCQVERERLGDADHGVLARDVREPVEAVGEEARRRRRVDDVAAALGDEQGEEDEVAAGDAQQVEVDDPLPRLDRQGLGRAHGEDADVVDDDVDPAEAFEA